jgi:hypothetical protein
VWATYQGKGDLPQSLPSQSALKHEETCCYF